MQVKIKSFNIEMDVKSSGIEFEVRPKGKKMLGDFHLTMSQLIWCKGKTEKTNGVKVSWPDFITVMSSRASVKAAVKAAKKTET